MSEPEKPIQLAESAPALLAMPKSAVPWQVMSKVPFRVSISVSIAGMKLRRLCELRVGDVLTANAFAAEDVPVRTGGALLGWGELDNVDGQMAVRLTRLA